MEGLYLFDYRNKIQREEMKNQLFEDKWQCEIAPK